VIKKVLITFLAVLYLGVSFGATLHYQYCNGRLMRISLGHHKTLRCNTCGMAKSHKDYKKCCQDKHQHLKIDKNQKVTDYQVRLAAPALFTSTHEDYFKEFHLYTPLAVVFPVNQAPPRVDNRPIFLRNCTFRI